MTLAFRVLQAPLLLLSLLTLAGAGLAQPQPALSPTREPQPSASMPSTLPSPQQLRDRFMGGCMAKGKDEKQRGYCNCVFRALMSRYTTQHYVMMDNLIISGGPPVSQFAKLAWGPEFAACQSSSSSEGR